MVKVQFKDGQTLSFDLNRQADRLAWKSFASGDGWSDAITAMGVHCRDTLHTLPVPNSGLTAYGFGAGLIKGKPKQKVLGESVWFCVADLRIELQVYNTNQKVTKVSVQSIGRKESRS